VDYDELLRTRGGYVWHLCRSGGEKQGRRHRSPKRENGGGAGTARQHSGEGGAAPSARGAEPRRRLPLIPAHTERQAAVRAGDDGR
jgi:hypothetical protein